MVRHTAAALIAGAMLAAVAVPAAADQRQAVAEPGDYRLEDFRAPVPATLQGATVLTTEALVDLRRLRPDIVLIDVLPAPRKPKELRPGAIWIPKARRNVPGSVWLPNTGYGVLPVEEEEYFRSGLRRLTDGDRARPLVFYCLADCWMSWNAAKRALSWGYTSVYWYPDGTDGWAAAGLPLLDAVPEPRTGE